MKSVFGSFGDMPPIIAQPSAVESVGTAPVSPPKVGGVIQGSAPIGAKLSENGNFVDQGGNQYSKGPASTNPATLTANVTPPSTTPTGTTAPAAISSSSAAKDLASKTGTVAELNNNAQAQSTSATTPETPAIDTSKTQTPATQNPVDDAISKILGELDKNLSSIQDNASTQGSDINKQIADNSAAETAAATDAYNKLSAISSGTYPLSPTEQQLLDSTKASYMQALQAQQTANSGALGQMQSILASLGMDKSAPMEATGFVYNVISMGTTKLADIATKMSAAVSKVQMAIQQNDFKNVQTAWTDMAKTFTDRTNALTKLQTDVTNAAKAVQTAATNYAKTAITAVVNSDKLDITQKKNAADELYHNGLLSVRQYAAVTARIKAGNVGVGTTKGTPAQVQYIDQQIQKTMGPDHYVNPNAYQGYFDWWMAHGYTATSFFSNFPIKLVNPANTWLVPYLKGKLPTGSTIG